MASCGLGRHLGVSRALYAEFVAEAGREFVVVELPAAPALQPNLAKAYANRLAEVRRALDADDGTEVLEAARALIDTVVVSPPDDPGEPSTIELSGNVIAMLNAGRAKPAPDDAALSACLTGLLSSSTKGGARGSSLPRPSFTAPRPHPART